MKFNLLLTITGAALFLGTGVPGFASSVSLKWDPNTETDLAGYRVYYKADSFELPLDGVEAVEGAAPIDVQNLTTTTISGLDPGRTYYLAVTAYNTAGLESPYSQIVAKETPPLPDTTAPNVVSFTIPSTATSLTIPLLTFTASDNVGVIGYLITENAATLPAVYDAGWTATPPTTYTFASEGYKTLYAWAKDAAGNLSYGLGRTITITLPDTTAPVVSAFTIPATAAALSVSVSSFAATDGVGVAAYLITESATKPAASASGWTASAPTFFTFSGAGSKTAYAWAKDAAGNVSASRSASVSITLPDTTAPVVSSFTIPATAAALSVPVSSFAATDGVGVAGYLITESATKPAASASGWTASAPTFFTFSGAGSKTAYAWAKDAAGNVSARRSASVSITLSDTTAPVVNIRVSKANGYISGTLSVNATATDNVGVSKVQFYVNGALASTATVAPYIYNWDSNAVADGSYTLLAKAYDAAGNIGMSGKLTFTVPKVIFR